MDQSKVNPFVGNTETSAGGSPVSAPSNPAANQAPVKPATPSVPVNPYAPAGAPYAPGSNTPAPDYTTSYMSSSDGPAVPNTGASAYTNFSPASSQNQDIFMPSDPPEKPKLFTKKFIIFAVIGVVLIIAAVVAGLIVQNNKKSNQSVKSNSVEDTFLNYANYLLYGKISTEPISDDVSWSSVNSEIARVVNDDDQPTKYLDELYKKFQIFSKAGLVSSDEEPTYIQSTTQDLAKQIEILTKYETTSKISLSSIIDKYLTEGRTAMLQDVDKAYSDIARAPEDTLRQYAEQKVSLANAVANLYDIYNTAGCIVGQTIDGACAKNIIDRSEINELSNKISSLQDELVSFEQNLVPNIIENSRTIYTIIFMKGEETR
ncbi:MAG: hypothetical protein Q4A25_01835 [Candidatus Saccharibacteria bacterium]|nr:hypothetical protein [Candidatus Saccharibacteria bacterium]